jgi:hypothetical protein
MLRLGQGLLSRRLLSHGLLPSSIHGLLARSNLRARLALICLLRDLYSLLQRDLWSLLCLPWMVVAEASSLLLRGVAEASSFLLRAVVAVRSLLCLLVVAAGCSLLCLVLLLVVGEDSADQKVCWGSYDK